MSEEKMELNFLRSELHDLREIKKAVLELLSLILDKQRALEERRRQLQGID